jgi:plasmid stabilization system protein ParE
VSRFLFGRYVEGDLREIGKQISEVSPDAARRLMIRFVEAFRLLAKHRELGHLREDLLEPPVRFWLVGSYLVIYLPEKPIEIIAVVHASRDVPEVVNRRL